MFYIKEGELLFEYEGRSFVAHKKDIVILDCMRPQRYQALTRTSFYWFHFDGSASRAYFEHFKENRGIHFQNTRGMEEHFVLIHDLMRSGCPDEGIMSVHIHRIMALLFSSVGTGGTPSDIVARARVYMDAHYMEKLSAEQIRRSFQGKPVPPLPPLPQGDRPDALCLSHQRADGARHEDAAEHLLHSGGDRGLLCFLLFRQFHTGLPPEYRSDTQKVQKADQRHHIGSAVKHGSVQQGRRMQIKEFPDTYLLMVTETLFLYCMYLFFVFFIYVFFICFLYLIPLILCLFDIVSPFLCL